jgi:hypothetical protein
LRFSGEIMRKDDDRQATPGGMLTEEDPKEDAMAKTIWKFGLLSGLVMAALLAATMGLQMHVHSMALGYTIMVLSFLLVYFGVRSYRDKERGGRIGFGRALGVGLLIGLVTCACYVATWEVIYFRFMPDFLRKMDAHQLETMRASGANEAAVQRKAEAMRKFEVQYDNPLINSAVTLMEPLPVAVAMALLSAGLLRTKREVGGDALPVAP